LVGSRERFGLANGQTCPSLRSRDKSSQHIDGGADLYRPKGPAGKERYSLVTPNGSGCFAILRLYRPTETAIGKSRNWATSRVNR
jgi:hypothetical protein